MDFSVILLSLLFTAMLYIPIPIVISSIIYNKNGTVKYKRVVVFSTIFVFLVLMLWHLFTDKQPPNVTAAVVWGAISMAICKKIFGKKPDSGESTINLENQQQSVISPPSQEMENYPSQIEAEKQQEANCSYPCKSEDALSGALHSERVDGVLKRTEEAWARLTPDERELLLKILEVLQEMPTKKKKRRSTTIKPWMVIALCGILFLALAFAAVYSLNKNPGTVSASHVSDATPSPLPSPTPFYKIYPFPNNGTYFNYTSSYPSCPLTITMPADAWHQYYYFVLKSAKGKAFTIYGHAGETIDIRIPAGYYTLYCASGHTWYGTKSLFGESGDYFAFDDVLIFHFDGSSYNGYEINLSESPYGNFEQHTVSADDFPE